MSNQGEDIAKQYKKRQIESAPPGKLIVMLYDGAIEFIGKAQQAQIDKSDNWIEEFHQHMIRTQNIITELMVALDMDKGGDVAKNLFRLYEYMNRRLVQANMSKEEEILIEVKGLLETLREAWAQIQDTVQDRPQESYSGINLQG